MELVVVVLGLVLRKSRAARLVADCRNIVDVATN